jgi:excisionase family DNA binding protein
MSSASSAPSAWLSQKEAAEALGVTDRTVRRLCADGKLGSRVQPVLGRKPVVMVDQRDVDRILGERVRPLAVVSTERMPEPWPVRSLSELPDHGKALTPLAQIVADAIRSLAAPASPKPWLTLDEAVEFSGLPRAYLVRAARNGAAFAKDVSASDKRAAWRFSREGLAR